jgi:hypothetical protein
MVAAVVRTVSTALSFIFAFLSFEVFDDAWKRQFTTLAASSLVAGIIILAFLVAHCRIKTA